MLESSFQEILTWLWPFKDCYLFYTQNPAAILNSNKDEYLINDCSSPIHFVVELCELIYVRTIVVASLELFSSIPKSFRVFATTERCVGGVQWVVRGGEGRWAGDGQCVWSGW